MKKIHFLAVCSFLAFSFSHSIYAYSNDDAYSSNSNWQPFYRDGNLAISVNMKSGDRVNRSRRRPNLLWIDRKVDDPIPPSAVVGGREATSSALYLCRGYYQNGMHPGKVVAGQCNIGWGGREVRLPRYQVLLSRVPLNWVPASNGDIPSSAIPVGYESNRPLYACQADYNGGTHPGKIIGQNCNFAWGGEEITLSDYRVLTR